ncbi:MAG: S8 family serine peptidase [Thermoplasmata archaeon]|nr:S8 family serine peptidase [Thermoplasmata archaeon]
MRLRKPIQFLIPLLLILTTLSISGCVDDVERTDWAFEKTQLDDMNDRGYKGEGIIIGIVDTGVNIKHPDLKHMKIIAWKDFINGRSEPYDDKGHGTHVAGIIAADGELDGGAPKGSFVIAKAIGESEGSDQDVGDAIDFCVDQGADVICLSLGGANELLNLGDDTAQASRDAVNQGVMVVAAAGNDGEKDDGEVGNPAFVRGVIAVGAVDKKLKIASFSSRGDNDGPTPLPFDGRRDPDKKPEVVGPGVKIRSTYKGDDYATASGTSQAAPFVAAGVALILEAHPQYKRDGASGGHSYAVEKVKDAIMKGAYKCPGQETPHDDHYGYGLFRAADSSDKL